MPAINNEVATGRTMKVREGFMDNYSRACFARTSAAGFSLTRPIGRMAVRPARAPSAALRLSRHLRVHLTAFFQPIHAYGDDAVARLQAGRDLGLVAFGGAYRDRAHNDGLIRIHQPHV